MNAVLILGIMLKVFLCSKKSLDSLIFHPQNSKNIRFSNGMRIDYSLTNVRKNILRDSRAFKMRKILTKYLKAILCCEYHLSTNYWCLSNNNEE